MGSSDSRSGVPGISYTGCACVRNAGVSVFADLDGGIAAFATGGSNESDSSSEDSACDLNAGELCLAVFLVGGDIALYLAGLLALPTTLEGVDDGSGARSFLWPCADLGVELEGVGVLRRLWPEFCDFPPGIVFPTPWVTSFTKPSSSRAVSSSWKLSSGEALE